MLLQKRNYSVYILLLVNVIFFAQLFAQQTMRTETTGVPPRQMPKALVDSLNFVEKDSAAISADTLASDSLKSDSVAAKKKKKPPLEAVVTYSAEDSLVFNGTNNANLFGSSVVTYQDIQLDADAIKMNLDSSSVYAKGRPDSLGVLQGTPIFKDKSGEYESKTIDYNFKSEKGYITNIVTQQGEGYLTGGKTKKMQDNEFYMVNGKYTTCDHHDCPHFYLQLTKAKVKPKKNIVTGPAYLVLADVPLPLAIPFGYFPFTETYSSGIIMPTYGDDSEKGFYLRDGGYYFAINDYMDLALTGEIYTKGTWGLNAASRYVKRYKYSGNFNLGYSETITGDKGLPDYSKYTDFKVTWTHSQDAKANPNMTLSASVNFATSGFDRNNQSSYYNANTFTQNTKSSTVNMTYRFPDSPFSISSTATVNQRSQDSTITVSFPNLSWSMSRIYPFKWGKSVGDDSWYEKIYMTYSGALQNSITCKQDDFVDKSLVKDWSNGIKHTAAFSTSFTAFNYLNISPSLNVNDRMYSRKVWQHWDSTIENVNGSFGAVARDTTYGFYNSYDFSGAVSLSTKLYGFFKPLPFLGEKVQMIRHVFTPSVSFSTRPDFGKEVWGMYGNYVKPLTDADGNLTGEFQDVNYSLFEGALFGNASKGKSGSMSISLKNNIEAKIQSDKDSTGMRKISLIDDLSFNTSYNFAADSCRWSDISASARIKITKGFTLQLSGVFDPYVYGLNKSGSPTKLDRYVWQDGRLPVLKSTSTSFSYTFNNDTFKKLFGGGDETDTKKDDSQLPAADNSGYESLDQAVDQVAANEDEKTEEFGQDGYMKWTIPWSLSVNYGLSYSQGAFDKTRMRYKHTISQNLSFSGNIALTAGWKFNFTSSYDFDARQLSYMNCNVIRDLHCWTMSVGFVPVGPYTSYNFSISVKSSLLSDLKYDKRSGTSNKMDWY